MYNNIVEVRAERLTPVSLAFIGDAVYTLRVREYIVTRHDGVVGTLHTAASKIVNAKAQAAVFDALIESGELTESESDVARRAKNAHLHSRSKSASVTDYHKATALEAVVGYLYLTGDAARLDAVIQKCITLATQNTDI